MIEGRKNLYGSTKYSVTLETTDTKFHEGITGRLVFYEGRHQISEKKFNSFQTLIKLITEFWESKVGSAFERRIASWLLELGEELNFEEQDLYQILSLMKGVSRQALPVQEKKQDVPSINQSIDKPHVPSLEKPQVPQVDTLAPQIEQLKETSKPASRKPVVKKPEAQMSAPKQISAKDLEEEVLKRTSTEQDLEEPAIEFNEPIRPQDITKEVYKRVKKSSSKSSKKRRRAPRKK